MMMNRGRNTKRRGATAVETAVVFLIVTVVMMAVFEYGRAMMVRQLVDNAAREGARQATAGTGTYSTADIQQNVFNRLAGQALLNSSGQPLAPSDIQVYWADPSTGQPASGDSNWTDAQFGQTIAVRINAQFKPMLPSFGFLPTSIPVNVTAMTQSEAN